MVVLIVLAGRNELPGLLQPQWTFYPALSAAWGGGPLHWWGFKLLLLSLLEVNTAVQGLCTAQCAGAVQGR